jgi:two-component system, OmpR family, copper resistance phosphate regulon response regulator CusR
VPPQQQPQQPKKIILIEDETFIADLYSYQLQKAGFIVKAAGDGATGLKLLEQEKFDLLLLDIMLPGMNGLEVLRDWRKQNPTSTMIVLLLTNLGQDAVIKEGFTLGAQGYLIKASYTPEQIVAEIKNALAGKPAGTGSPPPPAAPPTPAPPNQ